MIVIREEKKPHNGRRLYRASVTRTQNGQPVISGGLSHYKAVALLSLMLEIRKLEKDILTKLNSKTMQQELKKAQAESK